MNIEWTPEMRDRLRKDYEKAVNAKAERFEFDGIPLVTDYAKYLLEYLDTKFRT
jgi:hypothetical protein